MDYSKWDEMAKEVDKEEEKIKENRRKENRERHMKEQAEKQKKWKEKKLLEKKAKKREERAARKAKQLADGHAHKHGHAHEHGDTCCSDSGSEVSDVELPKRSCCGYADPEELKKAALKKKNTPQISLEEKNKKKMKAVEATREHGKQLFKEGKYEHAFAVYERGVLIINGAYGMSDEDYDTLTEMECLLDLNMALCQLKLEDYAKCISHCKMAINIDKTNPKSYYRWGQALIEMGEYQEAREKFRKVRELQPGNKDCLKQLHKIKKLVEIQKEKSKQWSQGMQKRMEDRAKKEQEKQREKEIAKQKEKQEEEKQEEENRQLHEEQNMKLQQEEKVRLQQEENQRQQIRQKAKKEPKVTHDSQHQESPPKSEEKKEEGYEVCEWLEGIKMSRYKDIFIEEGFDSLPALKHITAEDLMSMGVKRGHSRLISAEVQKLND